MKGPEARSAREKLRLSREDVAEETNSTPDAVGAWEDGRIRVIDSIVSSRT